MEPHLSALHLNTRSFNQHFDELKYLLDSVPFVFDFIGCSETFLTSHSDLDTFEIPGYDMIIDNRTFSSGGGVALYSKEDLVFQRRHDLRIDNTENSWIETNRLILGVICKPPCLSNRDFLDKLEETLHKIYLSKRKCLIMGNINIKTLGKSKIANEYLNLIRAEGFNPLIFEATRFTEKSQSCIDHIHSNFASTCTSGSITIEIADHLPVFTILYDPDISPFPDSIEYTDFKNFKSKSFKAGLRKKDWRTVLNCTNINDCLYRFLHKFNKMSNKHAPIKVLKMKKINLVNPG